MSDTDTKPRVTLPQLVKACRSYKSTRELAAELGTSRRTIERMLNRIRASDAPIVIEVKMAWDGQFKRSPMYRISRKRAA